MDFEGTLLAIFGSGAVLVVLIIVLQITIIIGFFSMVSNASRTRKATERLNINVSLMLQERRVHAERMEQAAETQIKAITGEDPDAPGESASPDRE